MTDEEEPTPAERADQLRIEFIEAVESHRDAGEPLNVLLSSEVRECLEMFLKQSAEVVIEAENGPLIGELVINAAVDVLPHQTKGAVREALKHYTNEYERRERLGTTSIEGKHEPSSQ